MAVALSAYGLAYADSHPASATAGPPGGVAELDFDVDSGTLWKEVFDQLTITEQSCIRRALDDESLGSFLGSPVLAGGGTDQLELSISSCLAPETVRALPLSILIAGIEGGEFGVEMELSEDEVSCLREWTAGVDIAAWIATNFADDFTATGGIVAGVFSCVPDLLLSLIMAEMGADLDELGEDGASCLREWAASIDWAALLVDGEVEDLSETDELVLGIFACLPDLLFWGLTWEDAAEPSNVADDHANFLEDATAVNLGKAVPGVLDYNGDADFFVFEAEEGEVYQVEVEAEGFSDAFVALYDANKKWQQVDYDNSDYRLLLFYWQAPSPGKFYIEVMGYGTGPYTLKVGVTAPTLAADRAVLEALYDATGGDGWRNKTNWLTLAPLGAWYGVTTDINGSVRLLYLADNRLRGEIPPELGNLSNLLVLDLSGNQLSGEIPPELDNLSNLVVFILKGNQLTGCIPASLQGRLHMPEFTLGSTQFCGDTTPGATAPGSDGFEPATTSDANTILMR